MTESASPLHSISLQTVRRATDCRFSLVRPVDRAESSMVSAPKAMHTSTEKAHQGAATASITDAQAELEAEAKRNSNLESRQIEFACAFVDALENPPPLATESGFDEYWQGEGCFEGIHYTKSWYYDEDR